MVDHVAIQLALRAKLLALSVATTGSVSLAATSTGFARVTGSFVADGFARGMEITPAGFGHAGPAVVTAVTPLTLSAHRFVVTHNTDGTTTVTHPDMVAEVAAAGRSLSAGLPSMAAWENTHFEPEPGVPYVEEQYIPGPEFIENDGDEGLLELRPMYSPRIYAPANSGISADGRYADAIRHHFKTGTQIPVSSGETLTSRGDAGPFRGQRFPGASPGWSVIPITLAFRLRTVSVLP